jgi:serine/threonine protein kinase
MERAQQDCVANFIMNLQQEVGIASDSDIKNVLSHGYNNGSDMEEVAKSLMLKILTTKKIKTYGLYKLKEKVANFCKIGNKSRESFAYTLNVIDKHTNVVVKTSQKPNRYKDILREYIIGIESLNHIRNIIPTIVYTLGAFVHDKKVYVVYEYIKGASVRELLSQERINYNGWLTIFVQILMTLEIAQRKSLFTHFDMHSDNVIVRDVPDVRSNCSGYDVMLDNHMYTVEEDAMIPVIIDFGHSCALLRSTSTENRRCIGSYEHPNHGMVNFIVPGNDMYKFLVSSLHSAKGGTQRRILKLFKFYGGNDPYKINTDISHMTNATSQYCREATYSSIASTTPHEFLNWIFNNQEKVHKVTRTVRKLYVPIHIPTIATSSSKIWKALAIAQQCIKGGCIIPSYYISVLKKYGLHHDISNIQSAIEILENTELDSTLDLKTLVKVFDLKVPYNIPVDILDISLKLQEKNGIGNVMKESIESLENYITSLTLYLQMYYIILELSTSTSHDVRSTSHDVRSKSHDVRSTSLISDGVLMDWIEDFKESPQFLFYNSNSVLINKVLRWSGVLKLHLEQCSFKK